MMQEDWDQWIIVVGIGWKLFITFNKIITCEKKKLSRGVLYLLTNHD